MPRRLAMSHPAVTARRPRLRPGGDDGQGLIELLAALALLTIAITALLTAYSSSFVSLRRAGAEGTALTVGDRQMEVYRTLPYSCVMLNGGTAPVGCPAASGFPNPYSPDQSPTATDTPDHRTYQVHTDISFASVDQKEEQVTVTVKDADGNVRAAQSSLFSQSGFPTP